MSPSRTCRSRRQRPCSSCSSRRCCSPTTATTRDTSTIGWVDTRACSPSTSGIGSHPAIGVLILALAAIGAVIGIRRRPGLDGPLAAIAGLSAIAVSTHFRMVGRYYFQITPWVLYFASVAVAAAVAIVWGHRDRRLVSVFAAVPLLYLVAVHAAVLPGDIGDTRDFNRTSQQPFGPTDPRVTPVVDAVERLTRPDDIIAFYRARTMTLYTDRRAFQTTLIDRITRPRRLLRTTNAARTSSSRG